MRTLPFGEQAVLQLIVLALDKSLAPQVADQTLHPGTVLAVFYQLREVVRPLDPQLADLLQARYCECAASQVAKGGA